MSPPKFHFWKDFGAGKKRRIPYYKQWWDSWRYEIGRKKVADHTLALSQLPPGSRVMDAEDFMERHIDLNPDELIEAKKEKIVHDHPWPFNYEEDSLRAKQYRYAYDINSRFFVPRNDSLALTNTLLESDELKASPPFEPRREDISAVKRQYDWSVSQDSVMVRLPKMREWPKINLTPRVKYGVVRERQETNVLNSMSDYSQTLLAKHYHQQKDQTRLDEILSRRTTAFPRCNLLTGRDNEDLSLNLTIDSLTISSLPLPQIESNPNSTTEKNLVDISPRTWKSVLEKSRTYNPDAAFKLPPEAHLHTIQLASRIQRQHRNPDEMLARSLVHAFGLAFQYKLNYPVSEPVVLQTVAFELPSANFYFMRYQLNSLEFDGPIKNQAWCSGPVNDLEAVLRYYLDFQNQSGVSDELENREAAQHVQ